MSKKISISLGEGVAWVVGKLKDAALNLIPDEGQLQILTERMREDKARKLDLYHKALRAQVELDDPEHPEEGKLASLRRKLARREKQGTDAGAELQSSPPAQRAAQLNRIMEQASADCDALELEIQTTEQLLVSRKETTQMRKASYEAARADLKRLEQIAPTILEQTKALQDAQKERLAAIAATGKSAESQAGALINQLQQDLDRARAGNVASEIIVEEDDEVDIDLDALAEEDAAAAKRDERMARWTKPSA